VAVSVHSKELTAPLTLLESTLTKNPGGSARASSPIPTPLSPILRPHVRHACTLLDATHELLEDGSLRAVRFRKPMYKMKEAAWELFVNRTARARHALGLRRRATHANNKPGT
jgi:hypothetical protein